MIIYKPEWVSHNDKSSTAKRQCIYSIDVHPDGTRLATGSLDNTVKIWNTDPIYNEDLEKNPTCQKLLCTLSLHGGAVLCVRWSKDGKYLASSSGNDHTIIIWELESTTHQDPISSSNNNSGNQESWRPIKYLREHTSDVQDLTWSNDNRYLASCGLDGLVYVWDAQSFVQIHKINQNGGFVKGVTWDPAGKYLASQSDDKKVRIWRTSDWREESRVERPFHNATDVTFFRRLSWSPDGSYIMAGNAVNGSQCVAALISRDHWASDTSLVGHTVPVEVTSFSPKLFHTTVPEENDRGGNTTDDKDMDIESMEIDKKDTNEALASVCALGGQDRGLSIWMTNHTRPLCVAQDIFENNVYDLAWTPDGQTLFACSQDGTVACLQLEEELNKPALDDKILESLKRYGYRQNKKQLPESSSQPDLEADYSTPPEPQTSQRIADIMSGGGSTNGIPANTMDSADHMDIDVDEQATTTTTRQPETTTSDKQTTHGFPSSSSNITATVSEQKVTIAKNGKRRIQPISVQRNSVSMTHTPEQSNTHSSTQLHTGTSIEQQLSATKSAQETSNYDPPCMELEKKGDRSTALGNKRKKLDIGEVGKILTPHTTDEESLRLKPTWIDSAVVPPSVRLSQVRLGLPKVKSVLVNPLSADGSGITMECHNCSGKQGSECTKLLTRDHGNVLWTDYLTSAVLVMTGNRIFSAIGCEDGGILIYSPAGRRLLPPIVLESTPVMMTCNDQWLLCLTATGLLYTWDVVNQKCRLSSLSISPLLRVAQAVSSEEPQPAPSLKDIRIQKNGTPFVVTNYHQAFSYDTGMNSWLRISDAWFIISEFWGSGSSTIDQHPLGWLSTALKMTGSGDSTNESLLALSRMDPEVSSKVTISHIENQLAAALVLESATEYKEWMIYYARRLSKENAQSKVEELCQWLMGPPYLQRGNGDWEPTILNSISKHELLKELLPILAQNRQLQRITTEFRPLL